MRCESNTILESALFNISHTLARAQIFTTENDSDIIVEKSLMKRVQQ